MGTVPTRWFSKEEASAAQEKRRCSKTELLVQGMSSDAVYFGATALTAVTDNAAITYLASLVHGLSADFKYALVAGAVTGGGLTIIANAPNPAGIAILRGCFDEGAVNPLGLLIAALLPTIIAMFAFRYL